MKEQSAAIGIDLGGTDIKAGLVDAAGAVLDRRTMPTDADSGPRRVLERLAALVRDLAESSRNAGTGAVAVGIGAPGTVRRRRGTVVAPPNLPGWKEVAVGEHVSAAAGLRVVLENDANAAAYGEFRRGAGVGCDDLVMLTLGTGIGGGVILGGRLWRGRHENAGETGHMIVAVDGRPCNCGQRGCLEAYASAANTAARAAERLASGKPTEGTSPLGDVMRCNGRIDATDVVDAARKGDPLARGVWDETCRYLAMACVNLKHLLNPQRIVLAGGMSAAGDDLLRPVRGHFGRLVWPDVGDRPEIVLASLGNDAGFVGAALLAMETVAAGGGA